MAKWMYFAKPVRYKGSQYPPNTEFEVEDGDVDNLKSEGGWVVEHTETEDDNDNNGDANDGNGNQEPPKEPDKQEPDKQLAEDPAKEPAKEPTFEELKGRAEALGIVVKGNWGIKKLTEVIEEVLDAK